MISISTLAEKVGGLVEGDSSLVISGIGDLRKFSKRFFNFFIR